MASASINVPQVIFQLLNNGHASDFVDFCFKYIFENQFVNMTVTRN